MILLGIHAGHNSAVAIYNLESQLLIGNLEVERLTRVKNDGQLSEPIIESILSLYKLSSADISAVAIGYSSGGFHVPESGYEFTIKRTTKWFLGKYVDWIYIPHHLSHAYSAAVSTQMERLLIVSADGWGDDLNTCIFHIDKTIIHRDQLTKLGTGYTHRSPANLWSAICHHNYNIGKLQGPGKLMALAAYGQHNERVLSQLIAYSGLPNFNSDARSPVEAFNYGENLSDTTTTRSQDVAYNLQHYTNMYLSGIVDYANSIAESNSLNYDQLAFCGGLALNIVATSHAIRNSGFTNACIPPFPNDSGLAFGNAVAASALCHGICLKRTTQQFSPFLGPEYSEDLIISTLTKYANRVAFSRLSDEECDAALANDIRNRLLVFRFTGGSESGPRALGNRSMLYDPSDPEGREFLNTIKEREWYRPFAPMILSEFAEKVLENPIFPSDYMTTSAVIQECWRDKFQGALHINNSCRPQLIYQTNNKRLHRIIASFEAHTGVPGLINTSFNISGPIVETPQEAISTFLDAKTTRKILYIAGKFRVSAVTTPQCQER